MNYALCRKSLLLTLTASSALCWSGLALAQTEGDSVVPAKDVAPVPSPVADAPTAADAATTTEQPTGQLEEIIITAEKRSTSLQNVPIAVTALSAETLSQAKVDTTSQLTQVTPNMVVGGIYENVLKITLRGVGSNDFVQNMNPAVATYIDEVYMGLATGQALQFFDLDRVEVLRGPQGTLYGKNATGGAISYFSKRPSTRAFEGGISATYGNYNRVEADGFVNVPLSEQAALRFSGSFKDRDGFFKNTFLGIMQRQSESKAGRLQLLFKPTDAITANLKVFASRFDGDVPHRKQIGILDPVSFLPLTRQQIEAGVPGVNVHGVPTDLRPFTGESEVRTYDKSTNSGASAHIVFDLGAVDLTSITAYEFNKRSVNDDPDSTRFRHIDNSYFNESDYWSQELRLAGDIGRIDYVIGAHYYRETIDARLDLRLFECSLEPAGCPFVPFRRQPGYYPFNRYIPNVPPGLDPRLNGVPIAFVINTQYEQINRSLAAFGDFKFKLTDALTLTGGLRYTTEKRGITATSPNPVVAAPTYVTNPFFRGFTTPFQTSNTWNNLSGRAVVDYKFGNSMVYASYSRGFRAGNYNGLGYTQAIIREAVNPETLTAYEAGFKSEFLRRTARLNLTGFYYDYDDLQASIFVNTTPLLRNAAKARIYGAEVEALAMVTEGLTLRFAGGYTNSEYLEFNAGAPLGDLSGNRLPFAPEFTATGGFTFERPINDRVTFQASSDIRYQSKTYFHVANFEHLAQEGHTLVNGRVGLDFNEKYSIGLWARNMFDKVFKTDGQAQGAPFGAHSVIFGEPRMYGLTASAKFR